MFRFVFCMPVLLRSIDHDGRENSSMRAVFAIVEFARVNAFKDTCQPLEIRTKSHCWTRADLPQGGVRVDFSGV